MLYGHPELTNDRQPDKALVDRLAREWPNMRFAWHNEWGSWIVLSQPIPDNGQPWNFEVVCSNPATGAPKELGSWIFRYLELNDPRRNDLVAGVAEAQKRAAIARNEERAAWRKQEVSGRIARAARPDLAPVPVRSQAPVDAPLGPRSVTRTKEGLWIARR